jgi:hypothetical protein
VTHVTHHIYLSHPTVLWNWCPHPIFLSVWWPNEIVTYFIHFLYTLVSNCSKNYIALISYAKIVHLLCHFQVLIVNWFISLHTCCCLACILRCSLIWIRHSFVSKWDCDSCHSPYLPFTSNCVMKLVSTSYFFISLVTKWDCHLFHSFPLHFSIKLIKLFYTKV